METFLIRALQLIMSLSLLVIIHEGGHFLFARLFKVRVEKFCLFFDPWFTLFKFKPKKSETEYAVGWLPLGGYVKIAGMIDESMDTEQMKQPEQPWEFRSKPAWQRLLIMVGGVLFNFLLAVKIRLARHGAKKRPYYRVVVADSRAPRDGRIIEEVGRYNPMTAPKTINLDLEKIADWQSKGAQLTDAVAALVKAANEGEKTETVVKKSKKQLAKEAEAAKAAAEGAEE